MLLRIGNLKNSSKSLTESSITPLQVSGKVVRRCSSQWVFLKFSKFLRKAPVLESLFISDFINISYENSSFHIIEALLWLQCIYF